MFLPHIITADAWCAASDFIDPTVHSDDLPVKSEIVVVDGNGWWENWLLLVYRLQWIEEIYTCFKFELAIEKMEQGQQQNIIINTQINLNKLH